MTKEYREYAKSRIEYLLKISRLDERDKEALEAAIQALSQEPTIGQLFSCEEVEELRSKIWKQVEQEPCDVSVSEKEPNEITEEVTLRFFKNSLKVRWHDFVIYNVEWLKKNWQMEMDIVCGVEPCDDAISREAVDKYIARLLSGYLYDGERERLEIFSAYLWELPSVTQKYGKWIEHPEIETSAPEYLMFYECSECGDKQCFCKPDIHKKRFCSNCGARMVEPQESEG